MRLRQTNQRIHELSHERGFTSEMDEFIKAQESGDYMHETKEKKDRPFGGPAPPVIYTRLGTNQYLTFIAHWSHSSPNRLLICSSSATALAYPTPPV